VQRITLAQRRGRRKNRQRVTRSSLISSNTEMWPGATISLTQVFLSTAMCDPTKLMHCNNMYNSVMAHAPIDRQWGEEIRSAGAASSYFIYARLATGAEIISIVSPGRPCGIRVRTCPTACPMEGAECVGVMRPLSADGVPGRLGEPLLKCMSSFQIS
jgi:hypothetical protein